MSMAGDAGRKPKRRKRKTDRDNPAQSAKFIKAAKKLGLGGKGEDFERAMDDLLRRKSEK